MSRKPSGAKKTACGLEEAYFEDHNFRNHTVNSLSWRNLTIGVGDSRKPSDNDILNDVSGIAMQDRTSVPHHVLPFGADMTLGEIVAIKGPSDSEIISPIARPLGLRHQALVTSWSTAKSLFFPPCILSARLSSK